MTLVIVVHVIEEEIVAAKEESFTLGRTSTHCLLTQRGGGVVSELGFDDPPKTWPRGYKTYFMLNSSEHEIFPAQRC